VRLALALYFLYLGTILFIGRLVEPEARAILIADAASALLVIGFAIASRRMLAEQLRISCHPKWLVLAAVAAPVTYAIAHYSTTFLHRSLGLEVTSYLPPFERPGYGLFAAFASLCLVPPLVEELAFRGILLGTMQWVFDRRNAVIVSSIAFASLCLVPPLVEELAFRGILLGTMQWVFDRRNAVIVSSIAFAILHLSVASFPHLFLLGLILGGLRVGSGSLVPGMLSHFLHNGIVFLFEWHAR
jgi:membrane protease YdiL (CAAX protease family)